MAGTPEKNADIEQWARGVKRHPSAPELSAARAPPALRARLKHMQQTAAPGFEGQQYGQQPMQMANQDPGLQMHQLYSNTSGYGLGSSPHRAIAPRPYGPVVDFQQMQQMYAPYNQQSMTQFQGFNMMDGPGTQPLGWSTSPPPQVNTILQRQAGMSHMPSAMNTYHGVVGTVPQTNQMAPPAYAQPQQAPLPHGLPMLPSNTNSPYPRRSAPAANVTPIHATAVFSRQTTNQQGHGAPRFSSAHPLGSRLFQQDLSEFNRQHPCPHPQPIRRIATARRPDIHVTQPTPPPPPQPSSSAAAALDTFVAALPTYTAANPINTTAQITPGNSLYSALPISAIRDVLASTPLVSRAQVFLEWLSGAKWPMDHAWWTSRRGVELRAAMGKWEEKLVFERKEFGDGEGLTVVRW